MNRIIKLLFIITILFVISYFTFIAFNYFNILQYVKNKELQIYKDRIENQGTISKDIFKDSKYLSKIDVDQCSKSDCDSLRNEINQYVDEIMLNISKIKDYEEKIKEISNHQQLYNSLNNKKTNKIQLEVEALKASIQKLEDRKSSLKSKKSSNQLQLNEIQKEISKLQKTLDVQINIYNNIKKPDIEIEDLTKKIKDMTSRIKELEKKLDLAKKKLLEDSSVIILNQKFNQEIRVKLQSFIESLKLKTLKESETVSFDEIKDYPELTKFKMPALRFQDYMNYIEGIVFQNHNNNYNTSTVSPINLSSINKIPILKEILNFMFELKLNLIFWISLFFFIISFFYFNRLTSNITPSLYVAYQDEIDDNIVREFNLGPQEQASVQTQHNHVNQNAQNPNAQNPNAQNPNAQNPNAQNPNAQNPNAQNPNIRQQEKEKTVFLWGRSNAGKSSLIASLYQSTKNQKTFVEVNIINRTTIDFIDRIRRAMLGAQKEVLEATSQSSIHEFILRDKRNDANKIKLLFHDGPGEAMLPAKSEINVLHKNDHKNLVDTAKNAQIVLFCTSAIEMSQDYFNLHLHKYLNEFIDEKTRKMVNCEKFVILLTKIDILSYEGCERMRKHISYLDKMSRSEFNHHSSLNLNLISPKIVCQSIDPIEQAKMILGKSALLSIHEVLPKNAKLIIVLCSAWGFDKTGNIVASNNGIFQIDHLQNIFGESLLEEWQPYGIVELIKYLLSDKLDTEDNMITIIDEDDLYGRSFDKDSILISAKNEYEQMN